MHSPDTATDFSDPLTRRIVEFIRGIGIGVVAAPVATPCFVPGIRIVHGALHVDESQLTWPGDLLHEAGHLAVALPDRRARMHVDAGKSAGAEMAAIAWSYAAVLHLGIDPAAVFHPSGYKGDSAALLENFAAGRYFGVPLLQYYGLCREKGDGRYPAMMKWVRC
jgi:hypothetical protein